ncbi:hypothetical protein GS399_17770 [Pedobacter sp. HMF7647]|uniref:Glycosyltransferase n=1 Tax=Hufsiella arboris TaxID=2695275 RepID=A0A7K1YDZ1_9SPHI|nr:glycosyltransferase family 4 protein [Hufsiella arboris]MXV52824.1 hypothetical protein [Hufsiella arboris]
MNILFISEMLPLDTYASEVVFFRHFKKLVDEGHSIHVVTDHNSYQRRKKKLDNNFTVHLLPNRKWYYPPYHATGVSQKIRFWDYFNNHVKQIIEEYQITNLVGYVYGDFLAPFCAFVQEKTQIPLISFFHDDTLELHNHKSSYLMKLNTEKILDASKKVFIASEAFKDNWPEYSQKFEILYPIPGEIVALTQASLRKQSKILSIGYSGSLYTEIIPYLDKLSALLEEMAISLHLIGNNEQARFLCTKYKNVTYRELFETADESNQYLLENCDACIIPYPEKIDEMPWIKTCFPSKFIQYTRLGIATITIAPKESALGNWSIKNKWPLYIESYELESLKHIIDNSDIFEKANVKITEFNNYFNPETIHLKLLSELLFTYDSIKCSKN